MIVTRVTLTSLPESGRLIIDGNWYLIRNAGYVAADRSWWAQLEPCEPEALVLDLGAAS